MRTSILQNPIQNPFRPFSTNLIALQMFRGFIICVIPPEFLKKFSKLTSKFLILAAADYYKLRVTQTEKCWMCLLRPFFQFLAQFSRFSKTTYAKMKTTYRVNNNSKIHLGNKCRIYLSVQVRKGCRCLLAVFRSWDKYSEAQRHFSASLLEVLGYLLQYAWLFLVGP